MSHPSLWWIIPELRQRHVASGEAAAQSSGVAVCAVEHSAGHEGPFSELAKDGVLRRLETSTMTLVVVGEAEGAVLVGKITISRSGTGILQSISAPIGR